MSPKYKQKTIIKQKKISDLLLCTFLFLLFIFFVVYTGTQGLVYSDIVSNDLLLYEGGYEIRDLHYLKNTNYLFVLENGDRVVVKPELMQTLDENNLPEKLSISYSKNINIFQSAYTAIEIKSNAATIILHSKSSLHEVRLCMCIGTVLSILALALLIIYIFLSLTVHSRKVKTVKTKDAKNGGRFA